MALATQEAIRDRIYTLIESQAPTKLSDTKFRRYRNEEGADFDAAMEKTPTAAFRRFQVRQVGTDDLPATSSLIEERVTVRFAIRIAYPQNHRYGAANAMDRDDVINADWLLLNAACGIYGRANFANTDDCTPLGAIFEMERADGIDYLVLDARYEYLRALV